MQNIAMLALVCFLTVIISGRHTTAQLIKEKCAANRSAITINSSVSIDSADAVLPGANTCHWILDPKMESYVVKIETTVFGNLGDDNLMLYGYDGVNTCPLFGTECLDVWTHERTTFYNKTCEYHKKDKYRWCKVNETTKDVRKCNPCFTNIFPRQDLTVVRNYCYQYNCANKRDTAQCFEAEKVPRVIKYSIGQTPMSFITKISFESCSDETTVTATPSSVARHTTSQLSTAINLEPDETSSKGKGAQESSTIHQPVRGANNTWIIVLAVTIPTIFLLLFIGGVIFYIKTRSRETKMCTETTIPASVYEEIDLKRTGQANGVLTTFQGVSQQSNDGRVEINNIIYGPTGETPKMTENVLYERTGL